MNLDVDIARSRDINLLPAPTNARVQLAWQGGEPTLMGLPFLERALALVEKHRRPGQIIAHSIQTDGTLIDEEWCRFFRKLHFLFGLSVDGPRQLHDRHRVDCLGHCTFERVMQGWRQRCRHGVTFNLQTAAALTSPVRAAMASSSLSATANVRRRRRFRAMLRAWPDRAGA